ncbi:HNH endonuclease [Mesorhizobium sp. L48C026A00]|uniref:HNH endonuclease n=1 Tax=Mesorhizobium sp. L48C026A00 TaxID=1287182 RepID=UPI0003D04540|nr:HNH endonuclease [Mesorhizobium sp. L48C026A00]ESZ05777.1 restriction endonuclease [Mesorhizobium sp. L48C026A00]
MDLRKPQDLLTLPRGETITKRNLYDLIQFSKVVASPYWGGSDFSIGNTPQQGINWIGAPPRVHGVVIKTRPGSYEEDGWVDQTRDIYRYSFKARNSRISYAETANSVLIAQPQHMYPVLLFTESGPGWVFEGEFSVAEIEDTNVVLHRYISGTHHTSTLDDEVVFEEGGRRYAVHLLAERSKGVVALLKSAGTFVCEICDVDFAVRYGMGYIEAHHKVPISSYTSKHTVKASDLALLCPNCHKGIHLHMKMDGKSYSEIRSLIRSHMKLVNTK